MGDDFGATEARWYRESNGARFVPGLPRTYLFRLRDGTALAFLPEELPPSAREAEFARLLLEHWCRHYGLPEARERLREFVHEHGDVAD
jgi:hypothetical protein